MRDYRTYKMSVGEWAMELVKTAVILCVLGMLFFRSVAGFFLMIPYGVWMICGSIRNRIRKRRIQLRFDFKDVILSIAASLQAGYTLEQSVGLAEEELIRLYPGERRMMMEELEWMQNGMKIQIPVEQLMKELADRSGVEEIRNFGTVLGVARRQGGNLVKISKNTADHISRKIQVEYQIEQMLSAKVLEKNIMMCMPYLILIYLEVTNRGYLDILYQGWNGRLIMFFCLTAVILAGEWAERIVRFEL